MKIGLCDDDREFRAMVRKWITAHYPHIASLEILEFMSGEALLEYLRLNVLDIVFLDCSMTGMDGIETTTVIREQNEELTIILLTDFIGYAEYGYGFSVYSFILKENFNKRAKTIFDNALENAKKNENTTIAFKTVRGLVHLKAEDISYVEGALKLKKLVLSDQRVYEVNSTFDEIAEKLKPHGFIRPHCSYLINARYIEDLKISGAKLFDGEVIPVARNRYREAKNDWLRWV